MQSRFLQRFGALYPQFSFRGLRRFAAVTYGPFGFVLRVALGETGVKADLCCIALTEGYPEQVRRGLRLIGEAENTHAEPADGRGHAVAIEI